MLQTEACTTPAQKRTASGIVRLLQALGNERRFRMLCCLAASDHTELNVTELAARTRLTQSALSQHLAKMRACGMLAVRRSGHRRFYRIAGSEELRRILAALAGYVAEASVDAALDGIAPVAQRAAEQRAMQACCCCGDRTEIRYDDNSESSPGPLA